MDIDGPRVSCITLAPAARDVSGRGDATGDSAGSCFIFNRSLLSAIKEEGKERTLISKEKNM